MPRRRLTREMAALRGADKVNPGRYASRPAGLKPHMPLGDPPNRLSKDAKATWREIAAQAHPGTLAVSDRFAVEIAACLLAEYRAEPESFNAAKLGVMFKLFSSFGMTPADRQNLGAVEPPKENPFDALGS